MGEPIERMAARVLVLDRADRVLLLRGRDPAAPESGTWWFTPGGGLADGESVASAARRELAEETGLTDVRLGPAVWVRTCEFAWCGSSYRQHETFFLARVDRPAVDHTGVTPLEADALIEHRWWSVPELLETAEVVYPTSLGLELARLLRDGPPARPVEVASDDSA